ncbi:MAG: hypothetical protein GY928_14620 [Colwellia sp.]|nr:hypothetical protein [Colwellia sp.]
MIEQKINKRLSKAIFFMATLHVLALAAYVFNKIPEAYQKAFFYNIDRVYVIFMMSSLLYVIIDKNVKIVLATCLFIFCHYFLIVNSRYLLDLTDVAKELNWQIYFGLSTILIILNAIYYVSRRK